MKPMELGNYYSSLICLNGHLITDSLELCPKDNCDFCITCGEKAISKCPSCGTNIRGFNSDHIVSEILVPSYCHSCGTPYPWTLRVMEAGKQIIDFAEKLSEEEKEDMKSLLPDMIKETPNTQLASLKTNNYLKKFGKPVAMAFKEFAIEWSCEFTKRMLQG